MPGGLNPMFGVVGKGIPHESYLRERERERDNKRGHIN